MVQIHQYDGWSYERLLRQRNRAHFLLEDPPRFVTVILSTRPSEPRRLFCVDSPCYHASGPLGEGDLVTVENMLCLRCPWHNYLVDLEDGREIWMEMMNDTDKKEKEQRQQHKQSSDSSSSTSSRVQRIEQSALDAERSDTTAHGSVTVHRRSRGNRAPCAAHDRDDLVCSSSSTYASLIPIPATYPLQPMMPTPESEMIVRRGKRVQRTHAVCLDEASGILTIEIDDVVTMHERPLPSDRIAGSIAHGALCMQLVHIKEQGLDRL